MMRQFRANDASPWRWSWVGTISSSLIRLRSILLCFLLVGTLVAPPLAQAANTTLDQTQKLDVTSPSVVGTLVGSPGGAYNYYQVNYQGGNAPILFTLTYSPFWGSGNNTFGFNLYGPSGLTFAGQVTGTNGNTATAQFTLVNGAAMSVLVQVYNYSNGGSVNYTLTMSGLSGGSSATVVGQTNTTPGQAIAVSTISASLGGAIVGSSAGSFHYYTLLYPGGNSSLAVTMNATPVYSGSGQAIGFNLYRQVPNQPTILTARSTVTAQDVHSVTTSATITGPSAAVYELQVYNYWPEVSISYGITATGLAGPAPLATGNGDDAHAIVLTSAQPGATGVLDGNRGGAYQFYLVTYPGNNSTFAVSITYQATGGASPEALGFKVYDGANLATTVVLSDDGTGTPSGVWTYQSQNAKTFGIQVFNYAANTTASYVLYQIGAQ
jgi:hypothetical protein